MRLRSLSAVRGIMSDVSADNQVGDARVRVQGGASVQEALFLRRY